MKRYQPILLQKLDIHVPGIHVRRLALHRHLSETTDIRPHAHDFSQCLFYLSGQGQQHIRDAVHATSTGTAIFVPPRMEHAFRRVGSRRPICLIIDFDWPGARNRPARVTPLPLSVLHEMRQHLAGIAHLQRQAGSLPGPGPGRGMNSAALSMSVLILQLLNSALKGMALTQTAHAAPLSPISRKVDALLASSDSASLPLGKLARLAGYQHDYLNRLLKSRAGLTLGQFRARKLLARAQQLLKQADSIAAVSGAVGFADPNYFARWFRKQTGMTPREWRRSVAGG